MTWEQRMSQRAHARARAAGTEVNSEAAVAAARAAYVADHGEECLSPEPPPSGPDGYCRECCDWLPIGNWPGVYTWKVTCHFECGHAHHADEIWLAG